MTNVRFLAPAECALALPTPQTLPAQLQGDEGSLRAGFGLTSHHFGKVLR